MSAKDNFYGSPGNGGESPGEFQKAPDKTIKNVRRIVIVFALAILALIVSGNCFVVTQPNEYQVIQQFGRIVAIADRPGLSYKMPFIQTARSIRKDVQLYDLPVSNVITMDKKNMVADSFALWRVTDPQLYIQTLEGSIPSAEARIGNIVYNSMKNVISSMSQTDIISGRDTLAIRIFDNIGTSLDGYGIALVAIETKRLDLPDENKLAVYERMISERNNIAAMYTAEGDSEATKIRNETDRNVSIQLSTAEAAAAQTIADGEAEYMRILAEAFDSAERAKFYTFVRALDAAKASLKGSEKTLILSRGSPIAELFYDNGQLSGDIGPAAPVQAPTADGDTPGTE
jgi:membrane protease subunit HflC